MVDVGQVVLALVAIAIIICTPIATIVAYDYLTGRYDVVLERRRNRRRRSCADDVQQLASEVRRLRSAVVAEKWHNQRQRALLVEAYDQALVRACRTLDIEQELGVDGTVLDREIERVRVEAQLQNAGWVLVERRHDQAA